MGVHIEKIKVTGWGPIEDFNHQLKNLTVIYGRNEKGKTTLMEAIITCLFKSKKSFPLREDEDFKGKAEIIVRGLEDKETVFKSKSRVKLNNYLGNEIKLLPLICVFSSKTSLGENKFFSLFDEILFPSQQLSKLEESVPSYVKIDNKIIVFEQNRGVKKELDELDTQIEAIDNVLQEIKNISFYQLKELKQKEARLKEKMSHIIQAKAVYKAKIKQEYEKTRRGVQDLETKISFLSQQTDLYEEKNQQRSRLTEEINELNLGCGDLRYLKEVKDRLDKFRYTLPFKNVIFLFVGLGIFLLSLIIGSLFSLWRGAILFGLGLLPVFYFFKVFPQTASRQEALKALEEGYFKKYSLSLPSYEELSAAIKEKEDKSKLCRIRENDLSMVEQNIAAIQYKIGQVFEETEELILLGSCLNQLKKLKQMVSTEKERAETFREDLILLKDVPLGEFTSEKEDLSYNRGEEESILKEDKEIKESIKNIEESLEHVKTKIISLLYLQETKNFIELVELLTDKRRQLISCLRERYFQALAFGVLNNVIKTFKGQRKQIIEEELNQKELKEYLHLLTGGRYSNISLEEQSLLLRSDDGSLTPFSYLSSGAKEQVSLALRLGIARRRASKEIFFILDDALLHTDWQRRPQAVDAFIHLAQRGWQLIYFTMDDYTRDLFKSSASSLKDNFQLIEI